MGSEEPGRARGRVVMLVDNAVAGDSRVQKSAASAAAAGWEVFLLGASKDRKRHHWRHEGAEVRLLPKPSPLSVRRHLLRTPLVRRPLAYRDARIANYRTQWVRAWQAELRTRRAAVAADRREGREGPGLTLRHGWLYVPRLAAAATRRWVALRVRERTVLEGRRARMDGVLDRLAVVLWRTLLGRNAWRRLEPHLLDFELAFAKEIDLLRPDIIHAHDCRMLGVGARAAVRQRGAGRRVKLLWDAHEYVPGVRPHSARWQAGMCGYERAYAPYADAVATVSPTLARLLQVRHGLRELPEVLLNAPVGELTPDQREDPVPDLRELCGVGEDTPLLVYSGGMAPQRGITTVVDGLAGLPGVHAALVAPDPGARYVREIECRAADAGVGDRLHVVPYVPYWQVVPFLSRADVGVIPIHHWPNHELALITKFFEYAHARLPLVVSDVRTMAQTTRETGQGEVFQAEDTESYVRAVRAVLDVPGRYRAAYDEPGLLEQWTWEAQAQKLDRLYARLLTDEPEPLREGDENADLCGGAREDRAAAGRPVRGQGTSRDGRRRGRARGAAGQRRDGAVPR
ncbi:glycosyltransferase [Streptomyces sp. NPDC048172]|uniref:glycosyltransferase n=1 Tax=Streptomyces sp. NPDC048172 TaxID=3365505 RepID=UPI00371DB926